MVQLQGQPADYLRLLQRCFNSFMVQLQAYCHRTASILSLCFNSFMVQLQVMNGKLDVLIAYRFNSFMVQLQEALHNSDGTLRDKFQFLHGTITSSKLSIVNLCFVTVSIPSWYNYKQAMMVTIPGKKCSFNSFMVQLQDILLLHSQLTKLSFNSFMVQLQVSGATALIDAARSFNSFMVQLQATSGLR